MIVANVILDGDEDRQLQFGAGFIAQAAPHLFDPETAAAELAVIERENRQARRSSSSSAVTRLR